MGQILCMSSYHLCIYAVTRRYKNPIKACFPVGGRWTAAPASYLRLNHHQILRIFIIFYTCVSYRVVTDQSTLRKTCIIDAIKNMYKKIIQKLLYFYCTMCYYIIYMMYFLCRFVILQNKFSVNLHVEEKFYRYIN